MASLTDGRNRWLQKASADERTAMMGRQLHPPGPIYSAQPQLQLPVACVPVRFANRDDDDGDSNSDNSAGLALGPCWDAGECWPVL